MALALIRPTVSVLAPAGSV